ncbi:cytochrome P450 [Lyophyllum atratum]|nr:cytochrome P450 [Lyophyllum atratum]
MMLFTLEACWVLCYALLLYLYLLWRKNRRIYSSLPLPPGPRKLPVIGNLLDMPRSTQWETYHKWCKELGSDIIHLEVLGTSIIIIDTAEVAMDLLEKRSSIYSGRARMPMINELMGWDFNFVFMPYGDSWRQHRRLMHQSFHPTAALRFHPHELKATHGLLRRLLDEPDDLLGHLRYMAGDTILSMAYGLQVLPTNDPYMETAEQDWMPFAGFKRKAKEWRQHALSILNDPFEATKRNIVNGNFIPSFTSDCLGKMDEAGDFEQQEYIIKSTAGTMYQAGTDTTLSVVAFCILGFLTNPEALKKAQREVDDVVRPGHLPSFDDEASLPYITALVKESLRWRDIAPLGVPHYLHVEDEYKGFRLPAGSLVIANSWAMLHNEDVYPDPFSFHPDRFMKGTKLDPAAKDPTHAAFGFGRRICPARYMAASAIWIAVASIVSTFDITKAIDEEGNVIEPSHEYMCSLVRSPVPFKCSIKPRSRQAEALIRETVNEEYY